jgi:hypothetical protein
MATASRTRAKPVKKIAAASAAPSLLVQEYRHSGGKHHETAHLRNILDHLGVRSPHDGKPYTEEMLLGIGGGIGAGYFLYEMCGCVWLSIGGRHLWQSTKAEFIQGICGRIGGRVTTKEAGGQRAAVENLHEALGRGRPAIVWVGLAGLPYHAVPIEWLKGITYSVVVYGFDPKKDQYLIGDRSKRTFTISAKDLAVARPAVDSLKSRTLVIDPPSKPPDLARAVKDGIQACLNGMTKPPMGNLGLSAFAKWGDLITSEKDPKGWPRALPPGRPLHEALSRVYQCIETEGTGGGAFRGMYADFLDEASGVLEKPALKSTAALYRELSAAWSALADAALPDDVPFLKETRDLHSRRTQLFEEKGPDGVEEMTRLWNRLDEMKRLSEREFPLRPQEITALLASLRKQIEAIHRMESGAVDALRAAVA